jgi:hypothetical protein
MEKEVPKVGMGLLMKQVWIFCTSFIPVRLFVLHLRRSPLMLSLWAFLFLVVSEMLFTDYGVHLVFLVPEYLGETGFASFFLTGLGLGLFTMAFHISSYIFYSYRYSFLATLDRPIYRFSINNSTIPISFILFYALRLYNFQTSAGFGKEEILFNLLGLFFGVFLMIAFVFTYFFTLNKNKNIFEDKPIRSVNNMLQKIYSRKSKIIVPTRTDQGVHTYLRNFFRLRVTRSADHYEYSKLLNALEQHHIRAAYFFIALIILVLSLGTFEEHTWVQIPAVATLLIMLSVFIMISGAFYSRFKAWTTTAAFVVIVILNYFSAQPPFYKPNMVTGMDYEATPATYERDRLYKLTNDSILWHDEQHWLSLLDNWKAQQNTPRPKMVILNVTGGGLRSSLWTYEVLNMLDSAFDGQLHRQTFLITGASGGMLGASFFREIKYLQHIREWDDNLPGDHRELGKHFTSDMLNTTIFNFLVNDFFFRFRKHEYRDRMYYKDRGVAFDRTFNNNTYGLLDKTLADYAIPEFTAQMPVMIFAPIMIQDGRRMVISAQPVSFLTFTKNRQSVLEDKVFDGLEFARVFEDQDALNISFLTTNRISASFPYITPLVNLPSEPEIELIDAGVRDNDGFEISMRIAHHFNDWLQENTSGVLFIRIKADRPEEEPQLKRNMSRHRLSDIIRPIGGVITSFSNLQIFNKSLIRQFGEDALDVPVEVVNFPLFRPSENEELSLSWRLTDVERERLNAALKRPENQHSLEKVGKKLGLPVLTTQQ